MADKKRACLTRQVSAYEYSLEKERFGGASKGIRKRKGREGEREREASC